MSSLREDNLMPFINEELKKLSQDIINQALAKPTMGKTPNILTDRLLMALQKQREIKLPKV